MPTKKDVFTTLLNLIKNNVTEVGNRVYASYPKKKVVFPLIVISNPIYFETLYTTDGHVLSYGYRINIYTYSTTSQELDELTEKLKNVLRTNNILDAIVDISEDVAVEYDEFDTVVHEGVLVVELKW